MSFRRLTVHGSQDEDLLVCTDCGRETSGLSDRAYAEGLDVVLCFECAVRRGGSWDEAAGAWHVAPDAADLSMGHAER